MVGSYLTTKGMEIRKKIEMLTKRKNSINIFISKS